jgi:hypothetical protein|tara:strand:+ start:1048 stop:1245 length:198 start_codon:yes stop_codon:yes gene_type:complete
MFLSLLLVCSEPNVYSCNVFSNTDDLFPTKQTCLDYTEKAKNSFLSKGQYARGGCIIVPESGIGA